MSPSHANTWIHLLHPVLNRALAYPDVLPARTADELATLLTPSQTQERPTSPLLGMMVLSDRSTGRKIPRTSRHMTVVRRKATRSTTSS